MFRWYFGRALIVPSATGLRRQLAAHEVDEFRKLTGVEVAAVGKLEIAAAQLRRHEARLGDRNMRVVSGIVNGDPLLVAADPVPLPWRRVVSARRFEAIAEVGSAGANIAEPTTTAMVAKAALIPMSERSESCMIVSPVSWT